jgi:chloramphenicol-sensitive protein RarD
VQYISPSMQFLLGVWIFHEPLAPARLSAFACIWAALALYSLEGLWRSRRAAAAAKAAATAKAAAAG